MSNVSYAVWAFAAGALIPLMAILNAGLARSAGGPALASVILFTIAQLPPSSSLRQRSTISRWRERSRGH